MAVVFASSEGCARVVYEDTPAIARETDLGTC